MERCCLEYQSKYSINRKIEAKFELVAPTVAGGAAGVAESSFELVSLFAGGQRAPHNTLQYSTITSDWDLSGTGSELRQIQQD